MVGERRRTSEMGCWSMGILEYWVLNASLHYSIIPVPPVSSTLERDGRAQRSIWVFFSSLLAIIRCAAQARRAARLFSVQV
jgi:hypothetical protein